MVELRPPLPGKLFIRAWSRVKRLGAARLRVLSYRWHPSHQYEILRLPADFTFATGFDNHITEFWDYSARPLRDNVRFCNWSKINPRDYDVCIVHFDENVLCPELSNGALRPNWGEPFNWLLSLDGLPKIGICHGTPPFKGQYAIDKGRKETFDILHDQRLNLVSKLASAHALVVCNSWQAKTEWGFENSRVICHGFDPDEFRMGSHTRDVLTPQHDFVRPHYRGVLEQIEAEKRLDAAVKIARGMPQPSAAENTNSFAARQFRTYVDHIGQFKFYLNTTLRSPMPRTRGEAMMAGTIPITLENHDVGMFIENGVDGFYSKSPEALSEFINKTIHNKHLIAQMTVAARNKAIEIFHYQRCLNDWWDLLEERVGRRLRRH